MGWELPAGVAAVKMIESPHGVGVGGGEWWKGGGVKYTLRKKQNKKQIRNKTAAVCRCDLRLGSPSSRLCERCV